MRRSAAVLSLILVACSGPTKGTFAYFPADISGLADFERRHYIPTEFKKAKEPFRVHSDRMLWITYEPAAPELSAIYALSLSRKSLGWVEIDLRNQKLRPDIGKLVDYYSELEPGEYLLRVAIANEVIDSIAFEIELPSDEDTIDFATLPESDSGDEILNLSRTR